MIVYYGFREAREAWQHASQHFWHKPTDREHGRPRSQGWPA
jgi:hypothetical protein